MNRTIGVMLGSLLLMAVMFMMMAADDAPPGAADRPLVLFCAASNQAVIEEILTQYEAEFGRAIQVQYGPSMTLLSSLEVSQLGDLYLPADGSFLDMAREKELVDEVLPIAEMHGVVAVRRGNPLNVTSFADLLRDDVRLVQAGDAAAIGKVTRRVLGAAGLWRELDQATEAYRTTVTDVANDLVIGAADAGIVYDAVLYSYPDLEYVELPELQATASQVSIGVLRSTQNTAAALHFARYVSSRDRGLKEYAAQGFRVASGDKWSERPELTLYAGSMLRPAIEDSIVEFEEREGVRVSRVYNGCGILVGQMEQGLLPDAFFACDTEFMERVDEWFTSPTNVSQNELVILVQKGNPLAISSLRDLAREDVRVGIGHEKKCAMGWLTQNTLKEAGLQATIMPNVLVEAPTGDMLVNQLRTGSLDAAVAYLSNAAGSGDVLDAIRIDGLECAVASQPWAVAKESDYPQLSHRLYDKLVSPNSQKLFAAEGFRWQADNARAGQDE
jgi:molybdate transport system substrate-binding protein